MIKHNNICDTIINVNYHQKFIKLATLTMQRSISAMPQFYLRSCNMSDPGRGLGTTLPNSEDLNI